MAVTVLAVFIAALTGGYLYSASRDAPRTTPTSTASAKSRAEEPLERARDVPGAVHARLAARGAWGLALDAIESPPLERYRWAVIGYWMGALDREVMDRARAGMEDGAAGNEDEGAELEWLDGIAAAVAGDSDAMDRARLSLTESPAPASTDLERSLRAFQLALDDEELRAARLLRRLEEDRQGRPIPVPAEDSAHPFLTPVDRLAAAHWFIRHGKANDALPLLGWWERPGASRPEAAAADLALSSLDYLQRARALREMGDEAAAARYFDAFVRSYDLPVDAHRRWVEDAREAAAAAGRDP
ncbi:MAG: hypothetical protein ABFS34_02000 [Gemmatimonadota bacterium]